MDNSAARHPYIVKNDEISGGSPVIRGSRVRVVDIVIEYEYLGRSPDQIVEAYPGLNLSQVHDALSFYYERRAEIDQEIADRKDRIAELEQRYGSDVQE